MHVELLVLWSQKNDSSVYLEEDEAQKLKDPNKWQTS